MLQQVVLILLLLCVLLTLLTVLLTVVKDVSVNTGLLSVVPHCRPGQLSNLYFKNTCMCSE